LQNDISRSGTSNVSHVKIYIIRVAIFKREDVSEIKANMELHKSFVNSNVLWTNKYSNIGHSWQL